MSNIAGRLLIARPTLQDGFFGRAVILMLQHGPEGAFGLVLNRPAKTKELPFSVYVGGPCNMDGLLMIHGCDEWFDDSDDKPPQVCPGVYLATADQFEKATESGDSDPQRFRIFTGYAGWGPKQLEGEMEQGSWVVVPADGNVIFGIEVHELWDRLRPMTLPKPSMN